MTFRRYLAVAMVLLFVFSGCNRLPHHALLVHDRRQGDTRQVFIQVAENEFTVDNLKKIFEVYRSQCSPQGIEVTVFSDHELLLQRINRPTADFMRDFAPDEAGRQAAERHNQQIYRPEGTMVANYSRFLDHEGFEYRLSKDKAPADYVPYDSSQYKCAYEGNR